MARTNTLKVLIQDHDGDSLDEILSSGGSEPVTWGYKEFKQSDEILNTKIQDKAMQVADCVVWYNGSMTLNDLKKKVKGTEFGKGIDFSNPEDAFGIVRFGDDGSTYGGIGIEYKYNAGYDEHKKIDESVKIILYTDKIDFKDHNESHKDDEALMERVVSGDFDNLPISMFGVHGYMLMANSYAGAGMDCFYLPMWLEWAHGKTPAYLEQYIKTPDSTLFTVASAEEKMLQDGVHIIKKGDNEKYPEYVGQDVFKESTSSLQTNYQTDYEDILQGVGGADDFMAMFIGNKYDHLDSTWDDRATDDPVTFQGVSRYGFTY